MTTTLKVRGPGENEATTLQLKPGAPPWKAHAEHRVVAICEGDGKVRLTNSGGAAFFQWDPVEKAIMLDLWNLPHVRLEGASKK